MTVRAWMWAVVILAGLYALHRAALWMERMGWIYYRKSGDASTLGTASLEPQAMVDPHKKRMLEVRQAEPVEEDPAGDPPKPGSTPGSARPRGRSR